MAQSKQPEVTVLIVTWNSKNDIKQCLTSVDKCTYPNFKVMVVDNASTDNTVEIIESMATKSTLIESDTNLYFTGGNNSGYLSAKEIFPESQYTILLNPDTIVEPDFISKLVQEIDKDKQIGIVGPKILFYPEKDTIYSAGIWYDGFKNATQIGHKEKDSGQYNTPREIMYTEGTCMIIRNSMIDSIGLFWDRLQMYSEDVELCIRANKAGWKVNYAPDAIVYHKVNLSINNNKDFNLDKIKMRNWLFIAMRHYTFVNKLKMMLQYLRFSLVNIFK